MKPIIETKNISVIYYKDNKPVPVLNTVNVHIYENESVGLIGESGSGKTTLSDSILGVLENKGGDIVQGEIYYRGNKFKEVNNGVIGKKISYIPQDPNTALDPLFPIETNFAEMLRTYNSYKSSKEMYAKINELLEVVNLNPQEVSLKSYPHHLSGGMKQRILIALALISEPELIIADEPTSDLDVTLEVQIIELLNNIKKEFKTAFFLTTHNLCLARKFCTRIYVMHKGEIVEEAKTDELFKNPRHAYTKKLMNAIM